MSIFSSQSSNKLAFIFSIVLNSISFNSIVNILKGMDIHTTDSTMRDTLNLSKKDKSSVKTMLQNESILIGLYRV